MDREKLRLISGIIFLATGGVLMVFALLAAEISLVLWMQKTLDWDLELSLLLVVIIDMLLAGISLRVGGQLAKGPYLPETLEGITKTTKAVFGKQ